MSASTVQGVKSKSHWDVYVRYGFAGAVCASGAHLILVPIDVVKTRLQVQQGRYKGMIDAFRTMISQEGLSSIFLGLTPTFAGYALQGVCKFGFFELFKNQSVSLLGEERASRNPLKVYLVASAAAETIASLVLCPFEAIRIRMVAKPQDYAAAGLFGGLKKMFQNEGLSGLYKGLGPLLFKQLPYTMVQLSAFTYFVDNVYNFLRTRHGIRKADMSGQAQIGISVVCGISAGVLSSLASHPADTILSRINMAAKSGKEVQSIRTIARELGWKGLWLGAGTRCIFTGLLSATIFLVYDSVKLLFGLQTTSGLNSKEDAPAVE